MKITYYTIATTRCMGIWRDERVCTVPVAAERGDYFAPDREVFSGFETRDAADLFIRCYPRILEAKYGQRVRYAKVEKQGGGEYLLTYECKTGFGNEEKWSKVSWNLKVNEYIFNIVQPTPYTDFYRLDLA